ncbi:hypothetical protein VOLCADRAFT_91321 [Volvox carteri f. nagariensis]|uniref:Uncharacterized protein n=1 Tax=Volvox carteri f. nagariensis TaxID=3068 RepID=D8TWR7_VOLCA|nr:uncharacterized protein VOLCADRAFT_91321 [Volvox carteri f. nagariensis]EFJ48098.1 hypothetical protein VOLCADRAFT_91321 [Volvox carteri f. nagariensis]|eukprot:XP_002950783.1 hypothetical protein VOLCADRAFT_91321 [Volvox carteri f. nagariensis]
MMNVFTEGVLNASISTGRTRIVSCLAQQGHPQPELQRIAPNRRGVLLALLPYLPAAAAFATDTDAGPVPLPRPVIEPGKAPDQSKYDPTVGQALLVEHGPLPRGDPGIETCQGRKSFRWWKDPDLREAAALLQKALNAATVEEEERLWTQVIDMYGQLDKPWVPDVVWGGRRGESGGGEGAGWMRGGGRGVALEALGRWSEAVEDYRAVLQAAPLDPAGWNNLGNAMGRTGNDGRHATALVWRSN